MKRTFLACALVVASGFSASGFAESDQVRQGMHERHMARMAEALDLSAEQQEQISSINSRYAERYRELSQAHRDEVSKLLDEEQKAKMQTLREERRKKMAKHHARQGEHKRGEHAGSAD